MGLLAEEPTSIAQDSINMTMLYYLAGVTVDITSLDNGRGSGKFLKYISL